MEHEIKNICESFLNRIHVPFRIRSIDPSFHDACFRAARHRGWPLDGCYNITPYLNVGVSIAATAYSHVDHETRLYIALYSGMAVGLDDACKSEIDLLKNFSRRFAKGLGHGHPILDGYDSIVREMVEQGGFDPFVSGTIMHAALDFILGMVIEYDIEENKSSPKPAKNFAAFVRDLAGISKLYGVLIFPKRLPVRSWVGALPATTRFINNANDILSFYKEELDNECTNVISIEARSSGKTKLDVLQSLADESVEQYQEALSILSDCTEAAEAFVQFSKGYVYYHTSCKRYKIADLWVKGTADMTGVSPKALVKSPTLWYFAWADIILGLRLLLFLVVTVALREWLNLAIRLR